MKKNMTLLVMSLLIVAQALAETKCFIAVENNHILEKEGDHKERHSPCSTFKIAISLMGYEEGILIDELSPELQFKQGYTDFLDIWKQPHNPTSWMKNSCIWYSQVITTTLGSDNFKSYITRLNYGNKDISGDKGKNNGLTHSWLCSSLQISPKEQIAFLQKLAESKLPLSQKAQEMTKNILFVEELAGGFQLYGKTGSGCLLNKDGSPNEDCQIGWFVGWLCKGGRKIIFAQYIEDDHKVDAPAGKRAKELAKKKLLRLIESDSRNR